MIEDAATPWTCCYTTLWNMSVRSVIDMKSARCYFRVACRWRRHADGGDDESAVVCLCVCRSASAGALSCSSSAALQSTLISVLHAGLVQMLVGHLVSLSVCLSVISSAAASLALTLLSNAFNRGGVVGGQRCLSGIPGVSMEWKEKCARIGRGWQWWNGSDNGWG